jgi:hypothetical protein
MPALLLGPTDFPPDVSGILALNAGLPTEITRLDRIDAPARKRHPPWSGAIPICRRQMLTDSTQALTHCSVAASTSASEATSRGPLGAQKG